MTAPNKIEFEPFVEWSFDPSGRGEKSAQSKVRVNGDDVGSVMKVIGHRNGRLRPVAYWVEIFSPQGGRVADWFEVRGGGIALLHCSPSIECS